MSRATPRIWTASLPWYDIAEIRDANDSLWQALSEKLRAKGVKGVPDSLDRRNPHETQWKSSALLMSQACGYDVAVTHAHWLRVIATPCYCVPECEGGRYWSHVLVRENDPAQSLADLCGRRFVINSRASHSGTHALLALIEAYSGDEPFFSSTQVSGSHEKSIELVRSGGADVAAIDCVTHELLRRHRPESLSGTRTLARTAAAPAPPYVASNELPEDVFETVRSALLALGESEQLRRAAARVLIEDIVVLPEDGYAAMGTTERHV